MSYDRGKGIKDLQLVSAWATSSRLVLGQEAVDKKSNEITAIPKLLEQLELKGCIITIDAMGTQKKISQQICQAGADYILALKGNQGKLSKSVRKWFEEQRASSAQWLETGWHHTEEGHHRLETRTIWQIPASQILPQELREPWQKLRTIFIVEGTRQLWNKLTHEFRFFISSLEATNQQFANYIRSHWGIENQLHWCLDVVFGEDVRWIPEVGPEVWRGKLRNAGIHQETTWWVVYLDFADKQNGVFCSLGLDVIFHDYTSESIF